VTAHYSIDSIDALRRKIAYNMYLIILLKYDFSVSLSCEGLSAQMFGRVSLLIMDSPISYTTEVYIVLLL